jgi:hypothetical protein
MRFSPFDSSSSPSTPTTPSSPPLPPSTLPFVALLYYIPLLVLPLPILRSFSTYLYMDNPPPPPFPSDDGGLGGPPPPSPSPGSLIPVKAQIRSLIIPLISLRPDHNHSLYYFRSSIIDYWTFSLTLHHTHSDPPSNSLKIHGR